MGKEFLPGGSSPLGGSCPRNRSHLGTGALGRGSFYLAGSFHQLGKFPPARKVLLWRVLSPKGSSDLGEAPTWNGRKLTPGNRSQQGHLTWRKVLPC